MSTKQLAAFMDTTSIRMFGMDLCFAHTYLYLSSFLEMQQVAATTNFNMKVQTVCTTCKAPFLFSAAAAAADGILHFKIWLGYLLTMTLMWKVLLSDLEGCLLA